MAGRFATLTLVLGLGVSLYSTPAEASVSIGQLGVGMGCGPGINNDILQEGVVSEPRYAVPGNGSITQWSTIAGPASGQTLTFRVFRKTGEPRTYRALAHDGPRPLDPGVINSFPLSIPVTPGDVIGLNILSPAETNCLFTGRAGDAEAFHPAVPDGQEAQFMGPVQARVNVTAIFTPTNTITVGRTTLHPKTGTATLNLILPNAGDLAARGKGIRASLAGAVSSRSVGAGPARLLVKAKGKKREALDSNGKVKVRVHVVYTPENGDPSTTPVRVTLRKR